MSLKDEIIRLIRIYGGGGGGGAGTPGGADTQVQFNDGGSFAGDAGLTWNKTANTLTMQDAGTNGINIQGIADGTDTGIRIHGGNRTGGNAGRVDLVGGAATTSGSGGGIKILSGAGAGNDEGGKIELIAGNGNTGNANGGQIDITGGNGDNGGNVEIYAGTSISEDGNGRGGDIEIVAGDSNTGDGGGVFIYGGAPSAGNKDGGIIEIEPGAKSGSGTDGTVQIGGVFDGNYAKVDLTGKLSFVGTGHIDSTGASDGDVLTSDGAGGSAWEAPAAGGAVDAADVTYTPTTLTDWNSDADPGDAQEALDQLAERVDDLEGSSSAPDASVVTYTPGTAADWDGSADPGDADQALDQLAERVKDIESAGAGNATSTDAYASRPAAATAGNLFLPSDGRYIERDSGSAWSSWGPIWPFTRPVLSEFAWVNQGTATASESNGGIHMTCPATAGFETRILKKSAPSVPYTITACFLFHTVPLNYNAAGILFRESSSGKMHIFQVNATSNSYFHVYDPKLASATSFSAHYLTDNWWINPPMVWMQISDNNTDRILRLSADGYNWIVFDSRGRTDYITANEVGFFCLHDTANKQIDMTLLHWKAT